MALEKAKQDLVDVYAASRSDVKATDEEKSAASELMKNEVGPLLTESVLDAAMEAAKKAKAEAAGEVKDAEEIKG